MISILITLVIVGVVLWLVQTYIPLAPPIKTVITVIVVLCLCLWLLRAFGIWHGPMPNMERLDAQ